jgi:hypothetical protein
MIKKINISENDRRTILSMHKLIVEQVENKKITGHVFGGYDKNPVQGIEVVLLKNTSTDVDAFDTLEVIDTTTTESDGSYSFEGLEGFNNLVVRTNQNEYFRQSETDIGKKDMSPTTGVISLKFGPQFNSSDAVVNGKIKSDNEISLDINISYKSGVSPNVEVAKTEVPCSNFVSDEDTFYGKSKSEKFNPNDKENVYDSIVVDAKIDAFNQYSKTLPPETFDSNRLLEILKSETGIPFKIVCSKKRLDEKNVSIKYVTVKINIKDFEILLQNSSQNSSQNTLDTIQTAKVNYSNIGFRELIKKSTDEGKPAFILFTREVDMLSNDLITKLNTNEETIRRLNENFIPVNYVNNESDQEGFYLAADSLDITATPAIVIIKGNPDTRPNGNNTPRPIQGSYTVIKKVIDLKSYFSNFKDYLSMANDLLK